MGCTFGLLEECISKPFKINTYKIVLESNGNFTIPEPAFLLEEVKALEAMIEKNKEKILIMLFNEDYRLNQYPWFNESEQQISSIGINKCYVRLAFSTWEKFIACYNKLTGYNIEPSDSLKTVKEKVEKGVFFQVAQRHGFILNENTFPIENEKYLRNNKGKYQSGITFILKKPDLHKELLNEDKRIKEVLNLKIDDIVSIAYGNYFKSKKGAECFDKTAEPFKNILIAVDWERTSDVPYGLRRSALYCRQAKSNAGRSGVDYLIFPIDFLERIKNN